MSTKLTLRIPNFPGKEKLAAKGAVIAAKVSQKSPEICIASAIVCGVTGTVLACRATLKVDAVLDAYNEEMDRIRHGEEIQAEGKAVEGHEYSVEDIYRDKFFTMVRCGVGMLRLYAPAIFFGTVSIGLIIGSYRIMAQRQATLLLAYETLQKAYDTYRQRVRDEIGEERELDLYKGVKKVEIEDEKGKKKKAYELEHPASPYTAIFDETSSWFKRDPSMNKFFLVQQQAHANDILKIQGHLFLNDVRKMLGLEPISMGQDVGWMLNGEGDGFVSFGIWDATKESSRRFINEYESAVWLDFNCDGFIKDKI